MRGARAAGADRLELAGLALDDRGRRGVRKELAGLYKKAADAYLSLARARLDGNDKQTARVYDSAFWLVEHLAEAPVHVIPCLTGRAPDGPNIAGASYYGSIFPAVWSFQLALRSRGLGSALTTLHLVHERRPRPSSASTSTP